MTQQEPQRELDHNIDQGADTIDEVIYLISHDLQSPVRAIQTIPYWIEEDLAEMGMTLPPESAEHLALLKSQGDRLHHMIEDLLTYSRIGRNQPTFEGDWAGAIDHIRQSIPGLGDHNVEFDLFGCPSIGADDAKRLLFSLVSNAIKHHDGKHGIVSVCCDVVRTNWRVTVVDDGPGIPIEKRVDARQIFRTLKSRDIVEGSGMGLPIIDKICQLNQGKMVIGDNPSGKGCCVTVELPIASQKPETSSKLQTV